MFARFPLSLFLHHQYMTSLSFSSRRDRCIIFFTTASFMPHFFFFSLLSDSRKFLFTKFSHGSGLIFPERLCGQHPYNDPCKTAWRHRLKCTSALQTITVESTRVAHWYKPSKPIIPQLAIIPNPHSTFFSTHLQSNSTYIHTRSPNPYGQYSPQIHRRHRR